MIEYYSVPLLRDIKISISRYRIILSCSLKEKVIVIRKKFINRFESFLDLYIHDMLIQMNSVYKPNIKVKILLNFTIFVGPLVVKDILVLMWKFVIKCSICYKQTLSTLKSCFSDSVHIVVLRKNVLYFEILVDYLITVLPIITKGCFLLFLMIT